MARTISGAFSVTGLDAQLRALANPAHAVNLQWFFKTGQGEYGHGDVFLGIKVPPLRRLARESALPASPDDVLPLLKSRHHEARMLALFILLRFFSESDMAMRQRTFDLYLANTRYINNWDLVDCSAPLIVGAYLCETTKSPLPILRRLARSELLWERRIAVLATFHYIRQNDFAPALRVARMLLGDRHDLIHKALGWMLREVATRDQAITVAFLKANYALLPRTTLRYAIERFPKARRLEFLRGRFTSG